MRLDAILLAAFQAGDISGEEANGVSAVLAKTGKTASCFLCTGDVEKPAEALQRLYDSGKLDGDAAIQIRDRGHELLGASKAVVLSAIATTRRAVSVRVLRYLIETWDISPWLCAGSGAPEETDETDL